MRPTLSTVNGPHWQESHNLSKDQMHVNQGVGVQILKDFGQFVLPQSGNVESCRQLKSVDWALLNGRHLKPPKTTTAKP